jgi:hypothetical protein
MFSDRNNNAYLIGQSSKKWTISVYKRIQFKNNKQNVCTLRNTLIKEDVIEIEDFKKGTVLVQIQ